MATAEKGCGGRGICGETWGLSLMCREEGESAQASPPPLSDRTSCVLAMSIFSQNWKKRKFGGQVTSPSSCCQHPYRVMWGAGGAPSQLLGKAGQFSLPPASIGAEPEGCDEATSSGLGAGGRGAASFPCLNMWPCTTSFWERRKGRKRRKTQFGLLKIELR